METFLRINENGPFHPPVQGPELFFDLRRTEQHPAVTIFFIDGRTRNLQTYLSCAETRFKEIETISRLSRRLYPPENTQLVYCPFPYCHSGGRKDTEVWYGSIVEHCGVDRLGMIDLVGVGRGTGLGLDILFLDLPFRNFYSVDGEFLRDPFEFLPHNLKKMRSIRFTFLVNIQDKFHLLSNREQERFFRKYDLDFTLREVTQSPHPMEVVVSHSDSCKEDTP